MPIISGQGSSSGGLTADLLPWMLNIFGTTVQSAHVGTWAISQASTKDYAYIFQNSTLAQNDSTSWDVVLAAGTWTLRTVADKAANSGISTVSLGGTSLGTLDWFNGTTAPSQIQDITGITVATTAKLRLTYLMATKNASSTNFGLNFTAAHLIRTA